MQVRILLFRKSPVTEWFNVVVLKTIVLAPEVRILSGPKNLSSLMAERVAVNHPDEGSSPSGDDYAPLAQR
jgi:hypothetical protein